eukprot:m.138268 g.138268  ORF g.138268 m.138268 type:complete len:79 (+) comp29982_c1_seq1:239-475(+)
MLVQNAVVFVPSERHRGVKRYTSLVNECVDTKLLESVGFADVSFDALAIAGAGAVAGANAGVGAGDGGGGGCDERVRF